MKKQISLFWAKLQLKVVRILPMLIAFIYVLSSVLNYFNIETMILNLLGGMSLLPLIFLYIASFAFRFCSYHRMFLHYITTADIINYMDYVIGIPISDSNILIVILILFGLTCFIALFLFLNKLNHVV